MRTLSIPALLHIPTPILDGIQIPVIRRRLARTRRHLALKWMRRDLRHVLVLGHLCLHGLLVASETLLFESHITTHFVEVIEDCTYLVYLLRSQIERWLRNYLPDHHNLVNYYLLDCVLWDLQPAELRFQEPLVKLRVRLVVARQVLESEAHLAEVLLYRVYHDLVLGEVDQQVLLVVGEHELNLREILSNVLIIEEFQILEHI